MRSLDDYKKAGQELYHKLHLATYPIAIKYIKDISEIPEGVRRPSDNGQKWCLCQAFTYARRWGWSVAMTAEDNFCTPSSAAHGWVDISREDIIQSQVIQGWHKDLEAEKKIMEHTRNIIGEENYARLRECKHKGFVCSPLPETLVIPDSVLVYGTGENMCHIIHALTYEGENIPTSSFVELGESCIKGGRMTFITQKPQVVIPGLGDRIFSGVFDYEIAIGIPPALIFTVLRNLFLTGKDSNKGILSQPMKSYLATSVTEEITPGFKFVREKIEESKKS